MGFLGLSRVARYMESCLVLKFLGAHLADFVLI